MSGTGVLRFPSDNTKLRYVSILADVIREPLARSPSFRYSPSRERFATMVMLRKGYVIAEAPIDYKRRRFDFVLDQSGQTLIAVKCAYEGILTTFFNLGNALALPSISVTNLIQDFTNLNMAWDECQFVMEGSTLLQVRLFGDEYERCNDASVDEKKPPPPPNPLPPVSPGVGVGDISPPYDDDDTVTNPNPIDSVPAPEFPQGNRCSRYSVFVTCRDNNNSLFSDTSQFFGEIEYVGIDPAQPTAMIVRSHGLILGSGSPCLETVQTISVFGSSAGFNLSTFNYSITPV